MINLRKNFAFGRILIKNFVNLTMTENEIVRNWRNDKRISRWMYNDHKISSREHGNFIKRLKLDSGSFFWLVRDNAMQYLGIICLEKVNFKHRRAFLGIYSNPSLSGVGQLLMQCLKNIAFNKANLHTLKLEVIENNENAIKFYIKCGFLKEGRLKDFVYKNGKWLDAIIMGILNKDEKNS